MLAIYQSSSVGELATLDSEMFFPQRSRQPWSGIDLNEYGFQSLDCFVPTEDAEAVVVQVEPRAWRLVLKKVD